MNLCEVDFQKHKISHAFAACFDVKKYPGVFVDFTYHKLFNSFGSKIFLILLTFNIKQICLYVDVSIIQSFCRMFIYSNKAKRYVECLPSLTLHHHPSFCHALS